MTINLLGQSVKPIIHPSPSPPSRYILELFPDAQIAVTQPRRMAAVNLAKRVAKAGDHPGAVEGGPDRAGGSKGVVVGGG